MLTLFYSPHMQSVDNAAGRASGHADVPLTPDGRTQAHELGRRYQDKRVDRVFSSDLRRARETAELAFAHRGTPIDQDSRLRECDYGELTQFPTAQVDRGKHVFDPFPGGESMLMVVERMRTFLAEMVEKYDGRSIVVIAHGANKVAIDYLTGKNPLERVVNEKWEWLQIPIWQYEVDRHHLEDRRPPRG